MKKYLSHRPHGDHMRRRIGNQKWRRHKEIRKRGHWCRASNAVSHASEEENTVTRVAVCRWRENGHQAGQQVPKNKKKVGMDKKVQGDKDLSVCVCKYPSKQRPRPAMIKMRATTPRRGRRCAPVHDAKQHAAMVASRLGVCGLVYRKSPQRG